MPAWRAFLAAISLATLALALFTLSGVTSRPATANPATGFVTLAAGEAHTCALTTAGAVECWGDTGVWQLGDGFGAGSLVPVEVPGLTGVLAIASGSRHACAITASGGVQCWGLNYFGQIGDGSTLNRRPTPVDVIGLASGVTGVSGGFEHTCAAMATGGVKCWGLNDDGQLGDGTTGLRSSPVDVFGLSSSVLSLDAGGYHTCAVTAEGGAVCWGLNSNGQLGDGTVVSRLAPVPVSGLTDAVAVAAGLYSTCAVTSAGTVKCWGFGYGATPIDVPGLSDVVGIDAEYTHTCALTQAGAVKCWGSNGFGQLGDGKACGSDCAAPVQAAGLSSDVTSIGAGGFHSCAVTSQGGVKCWGLNFSGQLGNGTGGDGRFSTTPVDVVEQDVKPTPTLTPCAPQGCPTPTPQPALPQTGLDFSITIDTDGDRVPDCGTGAGEPRACSVEPSGAFQVIVNLNALPPGVGAYDAFEVRFAFAGISVPRTWRSMWPDCAFPAQDFGRDYVALGCVVGVVPSPSSSYGGPLAAVDFLCAGNGSVTMIYRREEFPRFGTMIIPSNTAQGEFEAPSGGETLAVNCGPLLRGDGNCDTAVNAIDATLTLQLDAALLDRVGCPQHSDVNLDSLTNSVDASLTLQYDATLIDTLPPNQLH